MVHFSKIFNRGCVNIKWSSPLLSHLDITCTPHEYHMYTSCVSHVHLMGITCKPHGYHMYTSWVSHVHLMGIRFTLPPWYTFPKSSTGGVWILNGVAHSPIEKCKMWFWTKIEKKIAEYEISCCLEYVTEIFGMNTICDRIKGNKMDVASYRLKRF